MIINKDKLNSEIIRGISPNSSRGVGLRVNGWTFQSPEEVTAYFSYYGRHLLEGTVMAGGGYNAAEHVDDSVLSSFRWTNTYQNLSKMGRGVISKDKRLVGKIEGAFYNQYPLWSGKIGGDGLKEKLGWYRWGILLGVVKLAVQFVIEDGSSKYPFEQVYLCGIQKGNLEQGATMVGSRNNLYHTYGEVYGKAYPKNNPMPMIEYEGSISQINELRARYSLSPLNEV